MITTLSPRQCQVLAFLKKQKGNSPSLQKIADHLGVSSRNSAVGFLDHLERKGYIVRYFGRITLTRLGEKS